MENIITIIVLVVGIVAMIWCLLVMINETTKQFDFSCDETMEGQNMKKTTYLKFGLAFADLMGVRLEDVNLPKIDLKDAELMGANLKEISIEHFLASKNNPTE